MRNEMKLASKLIYPKDKSKKETRGKKKVKEKEVRSFLMKLHPNDYRYVLSYAKRHKFDTISAAISHMIESRLSGRKLIRTDFDGDIPVRVHIGFTKQAWAILEQNREVWSKSRQKIFNAVLGMIRNGDKKEL